MGVCFTFIYENSNLETMKWAILYFVLYLVVVVDVAVVLNLPTHSSPSPTKPALHSHS